MGRAVECKNLTRSHTYRKTQGPINRSGWGGSGNQDAHQNQRNSLKEMGSEFPSKKTHETLLYTVVHGEWELVDLEPPVL